MTKSTNPISCDTPPYHELSTSMLHLFLGVTRVQSLASPPPTILKPIRAKEIELWLIWEYDPLPIIHWPTLMGPCPLQARYDVMLVEEGNPAPLESRETFLPEEIANGIRMDMGKKFTLEINSSFGMASCKIEYSKLPVLWWEFPGVTTLWFYMVKIRIFEEATVDTIDSSAVDAKTLCNFLGWKAPLFQVKNVCFGDRGCWARHRRNIGWKCGCFEILSLNKSGDSKSWEIALITQQAWGWYNLGLSMYIFYNFCTCKDTLIYYILYCIYVAWRLTGDKLLQVKRKSVATCNTFSSHCR